MSVTGKIEMDTVTRARLDRMLAGRDRIAADDSAVAQALAGATPPPDMRAAPVAPARGPMQLVTNYDLAIGGSRSRTGAHWRGMDALTVMCRQAALRHEARGSDVPFVAPFTPGQIAVAADYVALVERRAAGGMRCASMEAGREGGGGGEFIDAFVRSGRFLDDLHRRIGSGVVLSVRRTMGSDNVRTSITARMLVDEVCVAGRDLSAVLRRYGWAPFGLLRRDLRVGLCAALDRMQGYRDA